MSLTTVQIITLARSKLLEKTSEIISDETLLIYANLTQNDILMRVFPNSHIGSATVALSSGVGSLPAGFGTLYGEATGSDNNSYEEVSINDFAQGVNPYSVTIENGQLKVSNNISSITIKYYKTFDDVTSGINPQVHNYLQELYIYGILERAFEDLQDEALSAYYKSKYESEIAKRSQIISSYEETNQRGGQMFSDQTLIQDSGVTFGSNPNYF